jgi:hypothetical protein
MRVFNGAEEVNRTPDLLITNQLLYQLSYFGTIQFFKENTRCMQVKFIFVASKGGVKKQHIP